MLLGDLQPLLAGKPAATSWQDFANSHVQNNRKSDKCTRIWLASTILGGTIVAASTIAAGILFTDKLDNSYARSFGTTGLWFLGGLAILIAGSTSCACCMYQSKRKRKIDAIASSPIEAQALFQLLKEKPFYNLKTDLSRIYPDVKPEHLREFKFLSEDSFNLFSLLSSLNTTAHLASIGNKTNAFRHDIANFFETMWNKYHTPNEYTLPV